jgi:hypothetical protein
MPETHWITPTLMVGRVPDGIARAVRVSSPTQAVAAINEGKTAVLPAGDWDGARQTMRWIGMDAATIEDRILFATTGFTRRY